MLAKNCSGIYNETKLTGFTRSVSTEAYSKPIYKTSLTCPVCGRGHIVREKMEDRNISISAGFVAIVNTLTQPHCDKCHSQFFIKINEDMLIEIEPL